MFIAVLLKTKGLFELKSLFFELIYNVEKINEQSNEKDTLKV